MTRLVRPARAPLLALVLAAVAVQAAGGCGSDPITTDSATTGSAATSGGTGTAASGGTIGEPAAVATAAAVAIRATGCRQTEELTGSGSVVGADLVVTVAHVVAGSDNVTVVDAGGRSRPAVLVGLDPVSDLALLAVPGLDVSPVPRGPLAAGDQGVFVIHDRDGVATTRPFTVVRRADLSMADIHGDGSHIRPGFELDAAVEPGDSGAVLVGDDGRAGAVVFAANRQDGDRAWATDLAALDPLLAAPHDAPVPSGRCVD